MISNCFPGTGNLKKLFNLAILLKSSASFSTQKLLIFIEWSTLGCIHNIPFHYQWAQYARLLPYTNYAEKACQKQTDFEF